MTSTDILGAVEAHHARSTGSLIILLDARNGGDWLTSEVEGGRWVTFCDDHGDFMQHGSRSLARWFMSAPEEWCSSCEVAR